MNPIASPIAVGFFIMGIFMLVVPPVGVLLIVTGMVIQTRYLNRLRGGRRHTRLVAQRKAQEQQDREYDRAIAWFC